MNKPLRVDAASLDRSQYKVHHEEGETLVIPLKDKYRWDERELHLRSLVLDTDGTILSAGFPKFFNLGENAAYDQSLAEAAARGAVEFPEKIDGSLIVADRIAGKPRLRTRGRRHLGEFTNEVESLIAERYPRLMDFLRRDPLLDAHSVLFELVSPTRAVVLKYEVASLFLLGAVDKRTVTPRWDSPMLAHVSSATGVDPAPVHALPANLDAALDLVRGWKGREGVVARFVTPEGTPRLLKIKAADYLRLHAYRSILGGVGARKIAWLLDLDDSAAIEPALARYGLDWEAAQFARAEVEPYLERRRVAIASFETFVAIVSPWLGKRDKSEKRGFVEQVRSLAQDDARFAATTWFTIAMKLFDAAPDDMSEAKLVLDGMVLGEAPATLKAWRKDADAEIKSLLAAPVREWD